MNPTKETASGESAFHATPTVEAQLNADAKALGGTSSIRAMRVLHVEDSANDAVLIRAVLIDEFPGCVITRVDNREQFTEAVTSGRFDLVLADYSLPQFDGMSALTITREFDVDLPVIFVSGAIGEERAIATLKAGATDYVLKDRVGRLVPSVRRAVHEWREREARKAAEQALRESEARFRSMADSAPVLIWVTDVGGACTYVNRAWLEFVGRSLEEEIGRPWTDDLHPDDVTACRAIFGAFFESRKPFQMEYRLRRRDGAYRWILDNGVPRLSDDGRFDGFIGSAVDITERRQGEQEIGRLNRNMGNQLSELETLLSVVPVGIVLCKGSDFTNLTINSAGAALVGVPTGPNQALTPLTAPYPFKFLTAGKELPLEETPLRRAMLNKTVVRNQQFDVLTADGRTVNLIGSAAPLLDTNGELRGGVASLVDLTELRRQAATIRESQERFRLLIEAVPQIVFTATPDGSVDYFNHRWTEYTGLSAAAAGGWGWQAAVCPDDLPRLLDRWQGALVSGQTFQNEHRFRRGMDGAERWHLVRAVPLRGASGKVLKWFGTCTDIEDQKLAQEVLRDHNEVLEAQVAERTRVAEMRAKELARSESAFRQQSLILQSVLNSIGDGVAVFDEQGELVLGNPAADQIFGASLGEGRHGSSLVELLAEDGKTPVSGGLLPIAKALRGESADEEVFQVHHKMTDRRTWISATSRPLVDDKNNARGAVSVVRDISRQKQQADSIREYQSRLRWLASELSRTEERERRRLSQALHDYLGQLLIGAKMKLNMLRPAAGTAGDESLVNTLVADLHKMLGDAIRYTRNLVFELSPPVLYELGLAPALVWLGTQLNQQFNLDVTVNINDNELPTITEEASVFLFQATRELLINVAKHADSANASVRARVDGGTFKLIVEDTGVGFEDDPERHAGARGNGFGLFNLRERLDLIGGGLLVESTPGAGTRATIWIPEDWAVAGLQGAGTP